jgi:hypothetical protein
LIGPAENSHFLCQFFVLCGQERNNTHRARCIAYHIFQTSSTPSTTTTASPSQTGAFASLYLICPERNKQDLKNLILNLPSATPVTLFATVHVWYTSNSIQDNAPTATNGTTHEP